MSSCAVEKVKMLGCAATNITDKAIQMTIVTKPNKEMHNSEDIRYGLVSVSLDLQSITYIDKI